MANEKGEANYVKPPNNIRAAYKALLKLSKICKLVESDGLLNDAETMLNGLLADAQARLSDSAPICPDCGSDRVSRNGKRSDNRQLYKCKNCDRQFSPRRMLA